MAAINIAAWLPVDFESAVITKVNQTSAIEATATRKPMSTLTKSFPRSGGADVAVVSKSGVYTEDSTAHDAIILTVVKIGRVFRIAEEDIDDDLTNVLETKKLDFATAYAKFLDNAAIGVNAAVGAGVPFTSIYRTLTTADASTGYTANANYLSYTNVGVTGSYNVTYDMLSDLVALIEAGDYFDEAETIFVAHPRVKGFIRKIKDGNQNPVFIDAVKDATVPTLFGYELRWSLGARVSVAATATPTGNPLIVAYNKNFVFLGVRSGPESVIIDGKDGTAALTDETLLKVRARRAFGVAMPAACAILELKPSL